MCVEQNQVRRRSRESVEDNKLPLLKGETSVAERGQQPAGTAGAKRQVYRLPEFFYSLLRF